MLSIARAPRSCAELSDGREVTVRPVVADDADATQAFVSGMSAHSRYLRFHVGLVHLPEVVLHQFTDVDQRTTVALVAQAECEEHGSRGTAIVADARYVVDEDGASAEFAIAIDDEWQGAGLGRQLLTQLAAHARSQGIGMLYGDILWGNERMLRLVRSVGAKMRRIEAGVLRAQISVESLVTARAN
jgi:acetyltransferase